MIKILEVRPGFKALISKESHARGPNKFAIGIKTSDLTGQTCHGPMMSKDELLLVAREILEFLATGEE